jgi:ubiquinone/menaquinone biosynthesis C-methylase UbiE
MAHKFDPKQMDKLDNPQRRQTMPPAETLVKLGLKAGDIVADIGCGIGYFSFPAAGIVGPRGKVYAADTSEVMQAELKKKLSAHPLDNLEIIASAEYEPGIPLNSSTFAFMSNVLHEVDDKGKFLRQVHGILKAAGKIAVIDWEKREMPQGPPLQHRLDKKEVEALLLENGFTAVRTLQLTEDFYAVTAMKKERHRS